MGRRREENEAMRNGADLVLRGLEFVRDNLDKPPEKLYNYLITGMGMESDQAQRLLELVGDLVPGFKIRLLEAKKPKSVLR